MTVRDLIILGSSAQAPTRTRNHGAYLVRWNEEGLLFDPGEGTQRQFIFANVAPPTVTRIFVSHFHGDHCLGLGSMLMRLNLDKVTHPIHCYYPASGKSYFDRLRYGTIYHERINVIEHPVTKEGPLHEDEHFSIEAYFLNHGVENIGWRIKERDYLKFDGKKLKELGVLGPLVSQLEKEKSIDINGKKIHLSEVSSTVKGSILSVIMDTLDGEGLIKIAQDARLLLCESTYLDAEKHLAFAHKHMTAKQSATLAKNAGVEELVLTHFSARHLDEKVFYEEAKPLFPNTKAVKDLDIISWK